MKVFISSVREGLEAERDALPGLILALGHEPLRFEDFTARPVPSREACLRGVREADVYVLLLGEHYGRTLEDTGLAPTEEEFVAARAKGIPVLVFLKRGVPPYQQQRAFIDPVSAYVDGRFRKGFEDVPGLLVQVTGALRDVAVRPTALTWTDLASPVVVPWRERESGIYGRGGTEVETYVVPVSLAGRLSATLLGNLPDRLARIGREAGLFAHDRALDLRSTESEAVAAVRREPRLLDAGIRAGRDRSLVVWEQLPADPAGAAHRHLTRARDAPQQWSPKAPPAPDRRRTATLIPLVRHNRAVSSSVVVSRLPARGNANARSARDDRPWVARGFCPFAQSPTAAQSAPRARRRGTIGIRARIDVHARVGVVRSWDPTGHASHSVRRPGSRSARHGRSRPTTCHPRIGAAAGDRGSVTSRST